MQSEQSTPAVAETTDVHEYLRPVLTRWPLIVLIVLTVTALTYAHYDSKPTIYTARTTVWIKSPGGSDLLPAAQIVVADPQRAARQQAELFRTRAVAQRAAKKLGYQGDPRALLGSVTGTPQEGADFLLITGTSGNAVDAARLANVFAEAFIEDQRAKMISQARAGRIAAERQLTTVPSGLAFESQRSALNTQIERLSLIESSPGKQMEQLDPAEGAIPNKPSPTRNALFGLVVSLLFAIGMAYALELFNRRLTRLADVEPVYGMPVLAQVPEVREPVLNAEGKPAMAPEVTEAFRTLRMNLQLSAFLNKNENGKQRDARTILVTSSVAGEGKSTIVRNLAIAYREAGLRVAAIDADLRGSSLTKLFRTYPDHGLVDVLTGTATLGDALQPVDVDARGLETLRRLLSTNGSAANEHSGSLSLLASGTRPADPGAVLASDRFRALVEEVSAGHDIVLLDSAPVLPVSDAVALLSHVDGVIVVTRLGLTTRGAGRKLSAIIRRVPDAEALGVAVNFAERGEEYYGYAYPADEPERRVLAARS